MTYIKFSNGSTTRLINMNDEVTQKEAEEDGFLMVIGKDGIPEHIDSSELLDNKFEKDARLVALASRLNKRAR